MSNDSKTCSKCGQTKNKADFYKRSRATDSLSSECKDCNRVSKKKLRENNRERFRECGRLYMIEFRRKNPDYYRLMSLKYYYRNQSNRLKISQEERDSCKESYVLKILKKTTGLNADVLKGIPMLIEVKKQQIKIKRAIHEIKFGPKKSNRAI